MTISPRDFKFNARFAQIHNYYGSSGELRARSTDGSASLTATLSSREPDAADEDRRARCDLTLLLTALSPTSNKLHQFSAEVSDYEYYGDEPGDHLRELLSNGALLEYFSDEPSA